MSVVIQDSYYNEPVGIVGDYMKAPVDTVEPDSTFTHWLSDLFISTDGVIPWCMKATVGQIPRRDVAAAVDYRDQ